MVMTLEFVKCSQNDRARLSMALEAIVSKNVYFLVSVVCGFPGCTCMVLKMEETRNYNNF